MFVYKKRPPEAFAALEAKRGGSDRMFSSNVTLWKPKPGENTIRILPPTWENASYFGYDLFIYYNVGVDKVQFLSRFKHLGESDPIAEAAEQAARSGNDALEKKLRYRRRVAYYIIDRANESSGVMLWNAPEVQIDSAIKKLLRDESGDIRWVDDPENGFDVSFVQVVDGRTSYQDVAISRRSTPLHVDLAKREEWLDWASRNPIPSIINVPSYERVLAAFNKKAQTYTDLPPAPADEPPAPVKTPPAPVVETPAPADETLLAQPAHRVRKTQPDIPPAPIETPPQPETLGGVYGGGFPVEQAGMIADRAFLKRCGMLTPEEEANPLPPPPPFVKNETVQEV